MNGLHDLALQRPKLAERLRQRPPKENAAVLINNYIASTQLAAVTGHELARILSAHKCSYADVKPALIVIYTQVLSHFLQDNRISAQERAALVQLKQVFRLSDAETETIDHAVLLPHYQQAVRGFFADGHFTFQERAQVEQLARALGQDEAATDALIRDEAFRAFEQSSKRDDADNDASK